MQKYKSIQQMDLKQKNPQQQAAQNRIDKLQPGSSKGKEQPQAPKQGTRPTEADPTQFVKKLIKGSKLKKCDSLVHSFAVVGIPTKSIFSSSTDVSVAQQDQQLHP